MEGSGAQARGSGVPDVAPLLLSHSQTLSVTQAPSYSMGSLSGHLPCLGYSPDPVTPWLHSFVPGLFPGDSVCIFFGSGRHSS